MAEPKGLDGRNSETCISLRTASAMCQSLQVWALTGGSQVGLLCTRMMGDPGMLHLRTSANGPFRRLLSCKIMSEIEG